MLTPLHDHHRLFLSLRQGTRYQLLILIPCLSHELTLVGTITKRLVSQCLWRITSAFKHVSEYSHSYGALSQAYP